MWISFHEDVMKEKMVIFLPYSLTFASQREGMGLLEYQAMPSFRDVAHDGWLCTLAIYNSSLEFHQLAAGQLLSGQPVRYGKGRRYGPSITYKITPAGSLFPPASQAGRRIGSAL
jgi:hypothetical protein